MRRLSFAMLGVTCGLAALGAASSADAQSPRRPRQALWAEETAGWMVGSGVTLTRPADGDRPEPPTSVLASSTPTGKYTTGTAYEISDNGYWLTARHVIDHCRSIMVDGGGASNGLTQLLVVELTVHSTADVAVLRTAGGKLDAPPVPLAATASSAKDAFEVGFPQAKPGAFASRYLGSTRARRIGANPTENDSGVWALTSSVPSIDDDVSGLAGGPAFDPNGNAIGIVIGESLRRGRLIVSLPDASWEVIRLAKVEALAATASSGQPMDAETYPVVARDLIQGRRVARVVCEVRRDNTLQSSHKGS